MMEKNILSHSLLITIAHHWIMAMRMCIIGSDNSLYGRHQAIL